MVYEGSHKLFEEYCDTYNKDNPSDWNPINEEFIETIQDRKKLLKVEAGSLVLWDSRTFHQNTCGMPSCEEERLIQYLCYLPKNNEKNDDEQQEKRRKFFENRRTTSHWPYPMNVVPEQPNYFNYYNPTNEVYIDYESLPTPQIDDLLPKIENLL